MARRIPIWESARTWRWLNLAAAVAWLVMVPISIETGWIYSVAFISAISIYANFANHIAAWRADEPIESDAKARR
jgi:hypothetical protein